MELLLVVLLLTVASTSLLWPLRGQRQEQTLGDDDGHSLEAAREAKLQEIRDLELDLRLGKLSDSDFNRLDNALKAEAIELLRRLDETRDGAERGAPGSA